MQYCSQNALNNHCIGKVEVAASRARFMERSNVFRWIDLICQIECLSTVTVSIKGMRPWCLETCLETLVVLS
jgi:hypothetical protein